MQTINTLIDPLRIFCHVHQHHIYYGLCVVMLSLLAVMAFVSGKNERKPLKH